MGPRFTYFTFNLSSWGIDCDYDKGGSNPCDLYGEWTWEINSFCEKITSISKLKSNAFQIAGYKWCILIPQASNGHCPISLRVENKDNLNPGWSCLAQFTIAVINKDPKKSIYSDPLLHRFCKKEPDFGWNKFMDLSLVAGLLDAGTLKIKARVQVIRERADRLFRCLEAQYRCEVIQALSSKVEQIFHDHASKLAKLLEDKARWSSLCAFWHGMDQSFQRHLSRVNTRTILKDVVRQFFIEKEATSALIMDSLYSGLKSVKFLNKIKRSGNIMVWIKELPVPIINRIDKDTLVLLDDALLLLKRAAKETLPPMYSRNHSKVRSCNPILLISRNHNKNAIVGEDFIISNERRLTELGRRSIEVTVLAHVFRKIEFAYRVWVALGKEKKLIGAELELEAKVRCGTTDKDKNKSVKKQGKQKRKG